MSKQFDELSKDLANGVSRRSAFRRFLAGIGAAAGLFSRRGTAQAQSHAHACLDHCRALYDGGDFGQCMAHSVKCEEGLCAFLINVNGGGENWVCTTPFC